MPLLIATLCPRRHAFAADSLLSLVYQIVRGNFPPIPKDMFSPGLSELVNALLVRDPNARPSLQQVSSCWLACPAYCWSAQHVQGKVTTWRAGVGQGVLGVQQRGMAEAGTGAI